MRITRVYTRSGDAGETGLATGERLSKDDERVEAYGTIDELNAVVGLARAAACDLGDPRASERIDGILASIQSELFQVGAELASPDPSTLTIPRVGAEQVQRLEAEIDELNADLQPLAEFLLPGGGAAGAALHHARTVCRRAERRVVRLARATATEPGAMQYLNRLSDLLFVLARWAAQASGEAEVMWDRGE
jgi:cob(I)alamin adenosyltransferase